MASTKIKLEPKIITPEMAKEFLEKNHPKNRPIQWGRVEAFVADIRRGSWQLTHQGVCFDAEGLLIDGQHRLQAIVRASIPVEMVVAHNDVGKFEDPIDRGQIRTLALISGRPHREIATVRVLKQLETGYQTTTPMTLEDLEEYSMHNEAGMRGLEHIKGFTTLVAGTAAAIIWAFPINEKAVAAWTTAMITGEMLEKGNPALAFRRWRETQKRIRPTAWLLAMAALNCLRASIDGQKLASVYTGDSGYRTITARRRKLKVPHTPSTDQVASMSGGSRRRQDDDDDEDAAE